MKLLEVVFNDFHNDGNKLIEERFLTMTFPVLI